MIKVFISHQKLDAELSISIAARLKGVHNIDSYLDVIDTQLDKPAEALADYIRAQLGTCTQLLAVVSPATASSQWVPWEIGVATEKDFPLATYSGSSALPPEFLRRWPYLRTNSDLDAYANASKAASTTLVQKRASVSESLARRQSSAKFFADLRGMLRQ